jgi:hypothetical protein
VRTIGLLGDLSGESSIEYYRLLNQAVRDRLGGLASAECVMWSVDFAPIERLQRSGDWDEAGPSWRLDGSWDVRSRRLPMACVSAYDGFCGRVGSNGGFASTTDVSTCRSEIDQYVRSNAVVPSGSTGLKPWRR